jgi:signal transduction histidine kinase/ActR/RegA family two-component response regulator
MSGPRVHAPLRSLRILATLSLAVPLSVYAIFGTFRYFQVRDEAELRVNRSLRVAHEHAVRVLDGVEALQDKVMDLVEGSDPADVRRHEGALHAQLLALTRDKQQIQSVWVFGPNGQPLVSSRFFPIPDFNVADREYFKYHQQSQGGRYLSQPLVSRTTGERVVDVSLPLSARNRSFGGVVSTSLLIEYFQKFHSDLVSDEPGLAINMVHENGVIYTRWPLVANAPDRLAANSPVMTRIRAGDAAGELRGVSSVDGRERLIAFKKVGSYPLYVGTGMDLTAVRYDWLRELGLLLAFGIPPVVALFLTALVALRRTREALDAAEKLGQETLTRRRAEEALLQAQKLEALGRLTGGVAHDFNNALMVISNNLYLIKNKHPEVGTKQVDSIGRAVSSATKLTRQLLAFSRRQALVPEHVRLQDKLPAIQELLGPVMGSQVRLTVEVAPDTAGIKIDQAELELALLNLGINARDAMPAGGAFSITARNAGTDLPPLAAGDMVMVVARDTGSGIEPHLIGKVFEPFFTTKPVGQGTGLGLSQVYGMCTRAGGTATIASVPGAGTSVSLFFPAVNEFPSGTESAPPAINRQLGKSILLVEDNHEVAGALTGLLESLGCHVTRVDRASSALEWLKAQSGLPDVMLTDVVMPGEMDGVGLARYVRAAFPGVSVLLMTGYAEQMDTIARLGFDILPKPCSAEMLAEGILRVTRPTQEGASAPSA